MGVNDERPRSALKSLYIGSDRLGDRAEHLGGDALRTVYGKLKGVESPNRVVAAGQALWPILDPSSEERAEVQLELADLYTTEKIDPELAVHVLEEVIRTGPRAHQDRPPHRLSVLFLDQHRYHLSVYILR